MHRFDAAPITYFASCLASPVTKHNKTHLQYFFFAFLLFSFYLSVLRGKKNKNKYLLFRSTAFRLEKLVKDLSAQVASQPNWNPGVTPSTAATANRLSLAGGPITDL